MNKRIMTVGVPVFLLLVGLVFSNGVTRAWAQESDGAASASSSKGAEPKAAIPLEAYRVDFSINELEDGKKINTRQYSMDLTKDQPQDIKIGTKIPVATKDGEFQYIDLGTNISGRLQPHNDQLELIVHVDMSSFAVPEQSHDSHSLIRQFKIGGGTLVVLGKPMVIGSADDPNSKRQFQVEVTMTKLR